MYPKDTNDYKTGQNLGIPGIESSNCSTSFINNKFIQQTFEGYDTINEIIQ